MPEPAKYLITLEIDIHGNEFIPPARWDWAGLLDLSPDDITVVSSAPQNDEAREHEAAEGG